MSDPRESPHRGARTTDRTPAAWARLVVLRSLTLAIPAAFVVLLAYGLIARAPTKSIDAALGSGHSAPAPSFNLPVLRAAGGPLLGPALADGRLDVHELRGHPVVLNMWASWCDPCRQEMPLLQQAWSHQHGRRVVFVGIDQQDNRSDARAFLDHYGVNFPTLRETGDATARAYGATGLPETFFISSAGRIVAHVIGELDARRLREGLAAARSGRPL